MKLSVVSQILFENQVSSSVNFEVILIYRFVCCLRILKYFDLKKCTKGVKVGSKSDFNLCFQYFLLSKQHPNYILFAMNWDWFLKE